MAENKSYLPKVTIITVVYNGEGEIGNTIKSVISQTYPFIEYIVIDGESSDGTLDVVKKYGQRITHWISEKDSGIYDAMNKGIRLATGEWILFRNSGDYFSSTTDVASVFDGTDYRGYDILAGDAILWDTFGYTIEQPEFTKRNREMVMPVWHPSTFVKAKLYKECPFDIRYRLAADHDFFGAVESEGKNSYTFQGFCLFLMLAKAHRLNIWI